MTQHNPSYNGLRHIGEWFRGRWRPMCQVYGQIFGVKPHGSRGHGECRACKKVAREF
jgi:hypothetical protein